MWPMMATEADIPATPPTDEASRLAVLRARLVAPMPDDRLWGWLGPLLVTAFGTFLRFNRLRVPRSLIFDETYYVKDAWSILKHGVEWNTIDSSVANPLIAAGHTNFFVPCNGTSACGEYVVQPEAGKPLLPPRDGGGGPTPVRRGGQHPPPPPSRTSRPLHRD